MKNLISLGNIQSKILFFIAVVSVPIANVVVTNLKEKNIDIFDTLSSFLVLTILYSTIAFLLKIILNLKNEKLIISASIVFYFFFYLQY